MAANWIKARQTKYWSYAATYIIVILAVLGRGQFPGQPLR